MKNLICCENCKHFRVILNEGYSFDKLCAKHRLEILRHWVCDDVVTPPNLREATEVVDFDPMSEGGLYNE